MRRAARLKEKGIDFIDSGTSGGIWGLDERLLPHGRRRPPRRSGTASRSSGPWRRRTATRTSGPPGAGHYVKMIHNGIEYGMLQAYAEGYEILHASKDFKLDLHQIAAVWNQGSVVRSWLNELAERAFAKDTELAALKGYVEDSGEGRWTVQEAIDLDVPAPVITLSLLTRFRSRQERFLRRQGHRGAAQRVRRSRGEEHMTARVSSAVAIARTGGTGGTDAREFRQAEPCTLVIFGAGDLLHRKLMPALFHLMGDGLLPDKFAVVAVARSRWTTTPSARRCADALKTFCPTAEVDDEAWGRFAPHLHYVARRAERPGHLRGGPASA